MPTRRALRSSLLMLLSVVVVGAGAPAASVAQSLCDANGDGAVNVTDGVQTLRAAASLPSACTIATCDADRDGRISVSDGVNVLRSAAALPGTCDAAAATPTPVRTPGTAAGAVEACDDDCRAALQICGEETFGESYESVAECAEDCVAIVEDFANDATNFDDCVDAQARFIECCTDARQCGDIPEGCGSEFQTAADACGGQFGGCPLIFF